MKRRILLVSLFSISTLGFWEFSRSVRSQVQTDPQPTIQLFVLAGQSNMVGATSRCNEIPEEFQQVHNNILWYAENENWTVLHPPTEPLPFSGMGRQEKFACGPEVSLGLQLHQALGEPIALVKYARNGTNLQEEWKVGESLYNTAIARFQKSIVDLQELGYNVKVSGFFWMQGESDARDRINAENYQTNLKIFIAGIRQALDTPHLPFVIGKIPLTNQQLTSRGNFPYANVVRDRQMKIAETIDNTATLETLDLPRQEDNLHFTGMGYILLGDRLARVWLLHFFPQPLRFNFLLNFLNIFD